MRPLVRFACGGSSEAEQLGILSMREECLAGQGKILIAPGAPPASCRERKAAGVSSGFGRERGRGSVTPPSMPVHVVTARQFPPGMAFAVTDTGSSDSPPIS
jgi:hypothetical protein